MYPGITKLINTFFISADLHQAEKYCNRYAKDSDVSMTEPEGSLPAKRIIKLVFILFDKNIHFIKAKASLIII